MLVCSPACLLDPRCIYQNPARFLSHTHLPLTLVQDPFLWLLLRLVSIQDTAPSLSFSSSSSSISKNFYEKESSKRLLVSFLRPRPAATKHIIITPRPSMSSMEPPIHLSRKAVYLPRPWRGREWRPGPGSSSSARRLKSMMVRWWTSDGVNGTHG